MILLILILAIVIAVEIPVVIYRPTFEDGLILAGAVVALMMIIAWKGVVR